MAMGDLGIFISNSTLDMASHNLQTAMEGGFEVNKAEGALKEFLIEYIQHVGEESFHRAVSDAVAATSSKSPSAMVAEHADIQSGDQVNWTMEAHWTNSSPSDWNALINESMNESVLDDAEGMDIPITPSCLQLSSSPGTVDFSVCSLSAPPLSPQHSPEIGSFFPIHSQLSVDVPTSGEGTTLAVYDGLETKEMFKLFKNRDEYIFLTPAPRDLLYRITPNGVELVTGTYDGDMTDLVLLPKESFPEVHHMKTVGKKNPKTLDNIITPGTDLVLWWKAQFLCRPNCTTAGQGHKYEFFRTAYITGQDSELKINCHQAPMKKPCEIEDHLTRHCSDREDMAVLKHLAKLCVSASGKKKGRGTLAVGSMLL